MLPAKLQGKPEGRLTSRPHFPMSMQPVEHSSIAVNQRPTVVSMTSEPKKKPLPKKQQARMEAVRVAKARITRRNSLRKQRQAQER
jgi:hypothetical protein